MLRKCADSSGSAQTRTRSNTRRCTAPVRQVTYLARRRSITCTATAVIVRPALIGQAPDMSQVEPTLERRVGYIAKRLQQTLRAATDAALHEHGLTTPQYAALAALAEQPGLSNSELARRGFVTRQTMNEILVGLERAGLAERGHSPHGGRVQPAALTSAGKRVVRAADPAVIGVERQMLAGLGPEQETILLDLLRGCVDNLEQARDANPARGSVSVEET